RLGRRLLGRRHGAKVSALGYSPPEIRMARLLTAYFVTAQVALSYLGLSLSRRFRSAESLKRITRDKHQRNARRIEAAILRLRGLFIKVGQLISIMANFLPDAFREELQRLQDQVPPRKYPDIEEIVRVDLRAMRRIFGLLRWLMPHYGFDTIYQEIREMVLAELDYR